MPRTVGSPAGKVVTFFRTAELEIAVLMLDLCREEVATRRQRSVAAKARAAKPQTVLDALATPRPRRARPPRKVSRRKARRSVISSILDE